MINRIKEQLAFRRLKKKLRAQTQIDRAFFASARESFIALIKTKGVATTAVHRPSFAWRYATVAVVAVLALTSAAGVFAEKLDVPPTSPLYPLKRVAEQVQLAVSTPAQQVALHQEFAQKRAKEIATLVKAETLVVKSLAVAPVAVTASPEANATPEMQIMLAPQHALRTLSKQLVSPASPSLQASISPSFDKDTEAKKEQLNQLKQDLESEAQKAVSQAETLHISAQVRTQICMSVVRSLDQSPASSSMRLARMIAARCQNDSRGR